MIKEKLKDEIDPLKAYSGKWVNVYFLKTGESDTGHYRYDTKEAALNGANELMYEIRDNLMVTVYWRGGKVLGRQISHVIQMPIGGSDEQG